VVSIGSLAGALLTARRRSVEVRDVVVGSTLFGVAMLLFSLAPGLIAAFPLAILVGFTSIIFMTTSTAIVQLRSDPAMRGRVLALQAIVFLGSTPIGGPIVGALCDEFGARSGLVLGGFAALAAGGWGYLACRARARRELVTRDLDVTGEMAAPAT
jgi:MFS family permease